MPEGVASWHRWIKSVEFACMSQLNSQYARMNDGSNPPKQRGCLFYGCSFLAILGLLMIIGVLVVGYFAKRASTVDRRIHRHCPRAHSKIEYPPEHWRRRARLKVFKEAMDKGGAPAELVLSRGPERPDHRGENLSKFFVQIEGEKIKGNVSWPLDNLGPLKLEGRYLNGTGVFKVALENGFLDVTLDTLEVKGKSASQPSQGAKATEPGKDATSDPETRATIEKLRAFRSRMARSF
jgi:hypothetical protein